MLSRRFRKLSLIAAFLPGMIFLHAYEAFAGGPELVTTYHYDNYRTGWNQDETTLTPTNVASSSFGLLQTVTVDDQVDAQPLYMPGVTITAGQYQGTTHDVVYVETGNNSIYAIDAKSGTVLLNPNFGPPVPSPLGCHNNGPNVGITSTPVIDPTTNTMYVMIYTNDASGPTYRIHALDISSLTDKVSPQVVVASHTLTNGTTYTFNATYQRQRPALLLANGTVYAGFGSFCDLAPSFSRGWLLGWQTGTLTPLAANQLFDTQATSPSTFFLSSIWMSGYGPAADDSSNVLVVTGNSDPSGTTYDGVTNIQESVIKLSSDLSSVVDLFTPVNWPALDEKDVDFGAGGVLVLPDQPGSMPHLAVAAGKTGEMFFMNEDSLGGYSSSKNNVLGTYSIGHCYCGQSYFVNSKSVAFVVSSGGQTVGLWKLGTSPLPALRKVSSSPTLASGQNGGFFTSVSSNGGHNAIIWALSRPLSRSQDGMTLYAFNPNAGGATMKTLFQGSAGAWPNLAGDSNQVPVVANGEVFVASNKQLQIFGLNTANLKAAELKASKRK
jgi:hypothetical protein